MSTISGPTSISPGGCSTRGSIYRPSSCRNATSSGHRRRPTGRGRYPEIRSKVFADICAESSIWEIDPDRLGAETARAFRAASLRRLGVIEKSRRLLDLFGATKRLGVVSNGQRVFSELEMRALGLYDLFEFVIFSSDFGYKKPDPRIYAAALERMGLRPLEVLFIGDTGRDDIFAPRRIGMQALHVSEAWRRYGA